MNNFDEWSQIISRFLKAEADLLTSVTKHEIAADSTRAAFIRGVLEPFLPSSYAIGSGRIIDSIGQSSDSIDIVIYRRDFPRLNLPGSSDVFLYESVLATIEVRTKLIRKTLFDALDTCASIAELNPAISEKILKDIATKNKLKLNDQKKYVHEHPLLTDRFNLIGRPPSFIYGFNGFQTSPSQLNDNVKLWLEQRRKDGLDIDLNSFPAVIATQGCIGWRNAAPLSANSNHLFGIGADAAPIRLIVFHLLYQLNRRLKVTPDGYGLKPSVDAYLNQMAPPEIQHAVGKATNAKRSAVKEDKAGLDIVKAKSPKQAKSPISRSQPTTESKPVPQSKPVSQSNPSLELEAIAEPRPVADSKPASKPEPVFKTTPVSRPAAKPEPEATPVPEAAPEPKPSAIPKPALGAMYHADPTLWEMPIPDASLIPEHEPEPESDPFIETMPVSASASKPDLEPAAPETNKLSARELDPGPESDPFIETMPVSAPASKPGPESTSPPTNKISAPKPEPDSDSDPFIQTMRISPADLNPAPKPAEPVVEKEPDSEPVPFLQTVRIPPPDSLSKSDPFAKTIPGLQNPPKSVH